MDCSQVKYSSIATDTHFDTADFKCKLAAEVKDFDPKQYMDPKTARRMEPFCQFAVAAAKEALETSGIDMEKEDPFRVGVSVGSGIGSLQALERNEKRLLEKGPGRVEPLLVTFNDQQHGSRKCFIPVWYEGKMH